MVQKVIHAYILELKDGIRTKVRKSMMFACDKLRLFEHYIRKRERCIGVVDFYKV